MELKEDWVRGGAVNGVGDRCAGVTCAQGVRVEYLIFGLVGTRWVPDFRYIWILEYLHLHKIFCNGIQF